MPYNYPQFLIFLLLDIFMFCLVPLTWYALQARQKSLACYEGQYLYFENFERG